MRFVARLASALILSSTLSVAAFAQTTTFAATGPVLGQGEADCFDSPSGGHKNTSSCNTQLEAGNATAYGHANSHWLTATASANVSQYGELDVDRAAQGFASFDQWVYLNGVANEGDYLVFHVQTSKTDGGIVGALVSENYAAYGLTLYGDNFTAGRDVTFDACGCTTVTDSALTDIGGGLWDLRGGIGGTSFDYVDYSFLLYAQAIVAEEGQAVDASAGLTMKLLGIDLMNENGELRASANPIYHGHMEISLDESVAPEPASVILMGTGLLGVIGVVRRRRALV